MPVTLICLSVGGNPQQLPPVGTTSRPACQHHIPFGYLILDGEADVGASSTERRRESFDTLATVHLSGNTGIVEDIVGGEKLVYPLEVPLSKDFIDSPADYSLVFFGHGIYSFAPPPISELSTALLLNPFC